MIAAALPLSGLPGNPSTGTAPAAPGAAAPGAGKADALRGAARDFETAFIAEMLKHAGFGAPAEGLGAGPGQDAFSGFMTRAVADRIAARGGFGLAEGIHRSLAARAGLDTPTPDIAPPAMDDAS